MNKKHQQENGKGYTYVHDHTTRNHINIGYNSGNKNNWHF